ncbi:MAG: FAD-dependent oxidoreductase, partial [Clostridia bacterium]|nr:FAD-dependent oxidoreductase [Clostridia bacterium]
HGNLIVGPDSENVDDCENKDTTSAGLNFVKKTAQRSIPSIDFRNSIRNFAGVRARTNNGDFIIEEAKDAPGFIDAAGICSPGLSAAPAIAEYIAEIIAKTMPLTKKDSFINERHRIHFKELSVEDKTKLIENNPSYGRVVCRCETVTEGEILETFNTPIPPKSVDGVKRRVGAGLGRCQGGFCGPNVVAILAKQLNVSETEIVQEGASSWMLMNL